MSEFEDKIDQNKKQLHKKIVDVLKECLDDEKPEIRLRAAKEATEFLRAFGHMQLKTQKRKGKKGEMDNTSEFLEEMDKKFPFRAVGS